MVANPVSIALVSPISVEEWKEYHDIRRTVLFEARGRFGVYDAHHRDELREGNYPKLLQINGISVAAIRIDIAPPVALFRRVAVDQDHQRQGHGRKLIGMAIDFVRDFEVDQIRSSVAEDAVGFYCKCGFTEDTPQMTAGPRWMYRYL